MFGSIRNYFSSSSKPETTLIKSSSSDLDDGEQPSRSTSRSKLSSILEQSASAKEDIEVSHPTQRFREDTSYSSQQVDDLLDRNLGIMGDSLTRLKMMGTSLLDEIEDQNEMVDRISRKTEDVDFKIGSQTKEMNRILKK